MIVSGRRILASLELNWFAQRAASAPSREQTYCDWCAVSFLITNALDLTKIGVLNTQISNDTKFEFFKGVNSGGREREGRAYLERRIKRRLKPISRYLRKLSLDEVKLAIPVVPRLFFHMLLRRYP